MKRILITVLCFVLLNKATAQTDKVILDNVFQNINKANIPTGYLQDYGVAFVNKESYNGILTDSNAVANLSAFRLMYNDIYTSKINPSATSMPSITTINNAIEPLQGSTATPLVFNISNYAGFEPDALLDGKVTFTNNQFFPVAGQNPWITNRFFAACPIDEVSPATNSLTLTYNSSLVYSNCGKQISSVSINFYNGAGYQNLPMSGTLTQAYTDSSGYKPFAIKVVCTDGSIYECYTLQYVHVVNTTGARFAAGNILPLGGNFPNTAPTPKNGTMQVIYSSKRPAGHPQHKQMVKPLIIINGLDETDVNPNAQASEKKNLMSLLRQWDEIKFDYDFNGQLDDVAGYDLIYINYYTLDKIEHNSDMLISMINWINANKAAGAEQNVVMGIELGGLISRYALAKMTRNSQPHQTRLLLTHDAPHQGAYMPLGYQHLAEDFGEMDYWGTPFRSMISDFKTRDKLKNSPVFLQFYLHKVNGATVSYNTFLEPNGAYSSMVNFTGSGVRPSYQFIATSQGSQCGTPVLTPGVNMLKYEEKIDDDPFAVLPSVSVKLVCLKKFPIINVCILSLKLGVGFGVAYKTKLSINALPKVGEIKEISYAAMEREIFIKVKFKVCVLNWCVDLYTLKIGTGGVITQGPFKRYNPSSTLPYESFAGGTDNLENFNFNITGISSSPISWSSDLWKKLGLSIGFNIIFPKINKQYDINFGISTYSFISRVSALDIANPVLDDYSKLLSVPITGLNRSKASNFNCHAGNNNGGITLFNIASGRFTKSNATWMFNEMQGLSNTQFCISECGNFFNISGPDYLCTTETYSFNGPLTATGNTVVWSINPPNLATPNPTTGVSTTFTKTGDGLGTITANIVNGCPNTGASKVVQVGIQTPTNIIGLVPPLGVSPGEILELGAAEGDNSQYNWFVHGGTIVGSSTQSQVTIIVDNCPPGLYNGWLNVFLWYTNQCGTGYYGEYTTIDCGTGGDMLRLAPNPSTGPLDVSIYNKNGKPIANGKDKIKQLLVLNKFGVVLQTINYGNGVKNAIINISNLSPDVYSIRAYNGTEWLITKLLKQ